MDSFLQHYATGAAAATGSELGALTAAGVEHAVAEAATHDVVASEERPLELAAAAVDGSGSAIDITFTATRWGMQKNCFSCLNPLGKEQFLAQRANLKWSAVAGLADCQSQISCE